MLGNPNFLESLAFCQTTINRFLIRMNGNAEKKNSNGSSMHIIFSAWLTFKLDGFLFRGSLQQAVHCRAHPHSYTHEHTNGILLNVAEFQYVCVLVVIVTRCLCCRRERTMLEYVFGSHLQFKHWVGKKW